VSLEPAAFFEQIVMDIIVFSDDYNWNGHPSSSMHIAQHLVVRHRVFWFNVIYRPPRLSRSDVARTFSKLGAMLGATQRAASTDLAIVKSPLTIPCFVEPFRSINRFFFRQLLGRIDQSFKLDQPAVIATNPFAVDFVKETRPWPAFYYCVDDYTEYPGVNKDAAIELERELLGLVRGVAATAARLLESRKTGTNDIYLPHGVDLDHFSSAGRQDRQSHEPVIGFFGLLSDWVDVEYIAGIAKARPDWTIELLGRIDTDISALKGTGNIRFRNAVPFSELPIAASNFDVGLIPFRVNQLTRAVNPLKLLEYFAMGLPVVSTNLPEVARFRPAAVIAETPELAVGAIESILASESDERRRSRIQIASDNSWARRANDLVAWIESCPRES